MRAVMRFIGAVLVAAAIATGGPRISGATGQAPLSYGDVEPFWHLLAPHLPAAVTAVPAGAREAAWAGWVQAHDARIRARVARGEEDTLVNLWLFGTSFTALPPARPQDVEAHGGIAMSAVIERRLEDFVAALASPGTNERLRAATEFLRTAGFDAMAAGGSARVRRHLLDLRQRALEEQSGYQRVLQAADEHDAPGARVLAAASLYRDRGLSGDTSLLSSFVVDSALQALAARGAVAPRAIRRVAIVGPGLDVINKAAGHDFYPEQTIQPFAIADSLFRLGLSVDGELSIEAFDISRRVIQHISDARQRARSGEGYLLHLPLGESDRWTPDVLAYWERAAAAVGDAERPVPAPATAGLARIRAVRVRPEVVLMVQPRDLNIVLERLEPLSDAEHFDLVVATNVFTYYDILEQALAVANIGRMLRPGGSLLTNQAVPAVPPMRPAVGHDTVMYSERQFDDVFWYRRQ